MYMHEILKIFKTDFVDHKKVFIQQLCFICKASFEFNIIQLLSVFCFSYGVTKISLVLIMYSVIIYSVHVHKKTSFL